MRVIQVPISEMLWPPKKSRKLRWRRARQACEAPPNLRGLATAEASGVVARVGSSAELKRFVPGAQILKDGRTASFFYFNWRCFFG